MDFVNQAVAQFNELFRSMSPATRIVAVLLLAVVVGSLALLINTGVGGPDTFLLSGRSFAPEELTQAEAAFGEAGLSHYAVEGTKISVPRGQQAAYLAALAERGALPRNFGDHLADAMNAGGPLASREDQRERMKIAKQNEIAQIIRSMQGISKAAVFYDARQAGMLKRHEITTASVIIEATNPATLDDGRIRAIRNLVAGAIAGLAPDQVTVTDSTGRSWSAASPGGAGSAMDDPYLTRKRDYQREYETKVLAALSYVPGLTVAVDVELDKEIVHTQDRVTVDPKAVAVQTTDESSASVTEAPVAMGRPGLPSQQPNAGAALAGGQARGPTSTDETSRSEAQLVAGHDTTHMQLAGLTPRKIALAVGIPSGYLTQIWNERNPPEAGQEPAQPDAAAVARIRDEVMADIRTHLLPFVKSPSPEIDPKTLITVTTFQQVGAPAIAEPSVADTAIAWLGQSWNTLGMLGLGLFALVMLRSMLRSVEGPAASAPEPMVIQPTGPTLAAATADEAAERAVEAATKATRLGRRQGGPSLREELAEIVKEDPAAAANILQSWIGNAS